MSDYKLVPFLPTPEMVSAAEDAYMPFGDMDMAIRMALLAAPAVQWELVGWQYYQHGEWRNGDESIKGHRKNTEEAGFRVRDVYAAPQPLPCQECGGDGAGGEHEEDCAMAQPAEQQPCPEAVREGAPYDDPAFSALCREHEVYGTAAAAQCAVFWEAGKRVAEQQPAPDVAQLVEALNKVLACRQFELLPGSVQHGVSAAMDAHRKQEGSHDNQ